MRLFISWSGEQSRRIAKELKEWFPLVLHYTEPWMSATDIDAGERWSSEVANELELSSFGILCLTPSNLSSAWILFEAGALSKQVSQSSVVPYLHNVDFSDISGPLTQFQAKKSDRDSTLELVVSVNARVDDPISESRLIQLFEMAWPRLEAALESIPLPEIDDEPRRPQRDVLEDLVSGVRVLEERTRTLKYFVSFNRELERNDVGFWSDEVMDKIRKGQKVGAIKSLETSTGIGLKAAKYAVEYLMEEDSGDQKI